MTHQNPAAGESGEYPVIDIQATSSSRGSASIAWLALLVSLAALGLLLWQMFGPPAQQTDTDAGGPDPVVLAEQAAKDSAAATAEASAVAARQTELAAQAEQQQQDLSSRLARIEDRMPGLLSEVEAAQTAQQSILQENQQLSAVLGSQLSDNTSQALLDVELLLTQASRQLVSSADLQGPLSLVVAAHERAARAQSPQLADLLKSLEADREQLQRAGERSVLQAADDLQRLAASLDDLPLKGAADAAGAAAAPEQGADTAKTDTESTESKWWQRLVKSSTELVALPDQPGDQPLLRITEVGDNGPGLMPSSAAYLIAQNLRLRILSARLSLLMHDQTGYDADLARAAQWLGEHFDSTDARVLDAQASLKELAGLGEAVGQMSLAKSLAALEQARQAASAATKEQR